MYRKNCRKITAAFLALILLISLMPAPVFAVTTGMSDGVYDFGGLGTTNTDGYVALGDKFKVPIGMYSASPSLGAASGDNTAIYLSAASTATAKIIAEGTGSCGSFTFKDLGFSSYQSERSFTSCNLVLKDHFGTVLSDEMLGASSPIPTSAIANLSALYPSHGEWNVAGVSQIEITYTLSSNDITYLTFENIKIAGASVKYLNAQVPTITNQPSGATVNTGGAANLTVTASDGVSLSYQWYSNTTNSNSGGNLIGGATNATYSAPTTALGTTYYYCKVTNTDTGAINETATKASNTATVVVNNLVNASAPTITAQPQDKALATGQMTTISVTASVGSGSLTYQWYSNATDSNLGGSVISGATGSTYSLTPASIGTTFYYCVVTNTDNSATGNKTAATASDTASVSATYGAGTFAFSGLSASDSCGSGYQKLGDLFKVPNGMYNASASLGAASGDKTSIYLSAASTATAKILAEGTGSCGSFTFKDLGVCSFESERSFATCNLVLKDRFGTVLSDETLGASSPIPTSAIANLSALYPSHGEWNVAGVSQIEITYTLSADTTIYLQFENIKMADISAKYLNAQTPTITSQPSGATVNTGGTANLTVAASGGVSLSYQWYSNTTNSNSGGTLISGATNATYSAPTTALGTTYYYCKATNTDTGAINETAAKASNTAAVVVNSLVNASAPAITAQPQDKALATGQMTTISVTASVWSGSLTYQWYSNTTDLNLGGSAISGATGSTYSLTPASIGTTFYYCVVTNTDNSATGNKTAATASDTASVVVTYGADKYAFNGLNTSVDSCGSGYQKLGDLFKVPNSMYSASASLGAASGDNTAIYLSAASTATAKILAEGTGSCGSFTFKDLGVSSYQSERSFTSCNLVLKDLSGTVLSNETLGASSPITASAITNLSALYPSHGEWNADGVSQIEITYTLSSGDITCLQLEYIKIVDISNDAAPTITTGAISDKTSTSAVLNGIVNANDTSTTVTFQYGTTTSYGASVTASQSPAIGSSATSVSYPLSGLIPNTTYHYRVVGVNSGGTTNGSDMTFTTSAVAPTVTTLAVTSVTTNGAILNGSVNANNASTVVTFEYGTSEAYGATTTASQSPVSGTASTAVSAALTGLSPNTTYHYRVVGVNTAGTTQGTDGTFTTSAIPASVTTAAVTGISGTGATLNGSVNANGASTTVTFQYGISTSYGTSVTASQSPAIGSSATSVSYPLTGLTPNTTYHYRVVGVNSGGTTNGSDMTFITPAVAPTAVTSGTTGITSTGATLNGNANSNNASTVITFEYGTTTAYGSSVTASQSPVSGTAPTAVSAALTGLTPNTTYHYRVVGVNTAGTTQGTDGTFTTSAIPAAVTTAAVTGITSTGATLNGSVNAKNASTVVTFEYGTTTAYGSSLTASGSPATGTAATTVSYTLSGLTPNATYHYRVVGVNSAGTTNGSDMIFTTTAVPSTATTSAVTSITSNGAILNGSVNANNASTTVTFEYGTSVAYGSSVTASQSPVSGTASTVVSSTLTGLSPNTTYHYRVVGVNTAGTTNGLDGTFTTSAIPYAVTINTNKDGVAAAAPGTVEMKQSGATVYTAANSGVGVYTTSALNGTYDIFINGEDTNQNITINNAANSTTVSYYTVNFTVSNAGTASGSSISATASGSAIASGAAVIAGKTVVITAAGAGASTYTYLWSGMGTSGQATATLNIASLSGTINADCTITGTTNSSSSSTSSSNNNNTPTGTTTTVIVNGQSQDAGTTTTSKDGDKTVTTVTLDDKKIQEKINTEGTKATVSIPISGNSDIGEGVMNGQTVKSMEDKEAVLEIKTESVSYTLPASEINISDVSTQLGEAVQLKDIKISVKIAEPPADTVRVVQDTANQNNYQIVVKPVEFEITCTCGEKKVSISKFNGYVERTVAIPDGVDPSKITTGIVLNTDGTFSHVPTIIVKIDGKYYAKINSLTNSTYSVIYNPVEFADVAKHWAKDSVNAMGSRLIVSGSGNGNYSPNKEITRAEFAAIVIRALGLKTQEPESSFNDVKATAWYAGTVETAVSYGIITGYSNGKFGPNDKITREQAMTMIARAMKLTGLYDSMTEAEMSAQISSYADGVSSSKYAKEGVAACLKTGVVSGKSSSKLAPKAYITRAEVAVIIERMLEKSELI